MEFTSEVNDLKAGSRINRILKRENINIFRTIRKTDGDYTRTPVETVEALLEQHFEDEEEESMHLEIMDCTEGRVINSYKQKTGKGVINEFQSLQFTRA